MLISQSSVEEFLAFASDEGYLAGIGYLTAAGPTLIRSNRAIAACGVQQA
jgi:hypothetical protein